MALTENERRSLTSIRQRLDRLRAFLIERASPLDGSAIGVWYDHLAATKEIVGNANNDLSFVACLMAKDYLSRHLEMEPFDVALKPQGAPGIDIDERTVDGERVVDARTSPTRSTPRPNVGRERSASAGVVIIRARSAERLGSYPLPRLKALELTEPSSRRW
jgi:hypothetical protein